MDLSSIGIGFPAVQSLDDADLNADSADLKSLAWQ